MSSNLMPTQILFRPIRGAPPIINLVRGHSEADTSPRLKSLVSVLDDPQNEAGQEITS